MVLVNSRVDHPVIRHYATHIVYRPIVQVLHPALCEVSHYLSDGQPGLTIVLTRVEDILYLQKGRKRSDECVFDHFMCNDNSRIREGKVTDGGVGNIWLK